MPKIFSLSATPSFACCFQVRASLPAAWCRDGSTRKSPNLRVGVAGQVGFNSTLLTLYRLLSSFSRLFLSAWSALPVPRKQLLVNPMVAHAFFGAPRKVAG
jgi:hypothetical protein